MVFILKAEPALFPLRHTSFPSERSDPKHNPSGKHCTAPLCFTHTIPVILIWGIKQNEQESKNWFFWNLFESYWGRFLNILLFINQQLECCRCEHAPWLPELPVEQPGFVLEVKLFQVLQRNALLLLPASVQQTLHAALKQTGNSLSETPAWHIVTVSSVPSCGDESTHHRNVAVNWVGGKQRQQRFNVIS